MWTSAWLMLWVSSIVFTICSFIWRKHVLFAFLAAIFWFACGQGMTQLDFYWAGDINPITYDLEMGDHGGDIGLFYLFHGCGWVMIVYALYNGFLIMKGDAKTIMSGRGYEMENL
jgi:hypothetical protein